MPVFKLSQDIGAVNQAASSPMHPARSTFLLVLYICLNGYWCHVVFQEVQERIRIVDNAYFNALPPHAVVSDQIKVVSPSKGTQYLTLAKSFMRRLVHSFVLHCSLLRKIGDDGRLRLAADMAQVPVACICSAID